MSRPPGAPADGSRERRGEREFAGPPRIVRDVEIEQMRWCWPGERSRRPQSDEAEDDSSYWLG